MSHVDGLPAHLAKALPSPTPAAEPAPAEGELLLTFEAAPKDPAAPEPLGQISIVEHRSPIADLLNRYPIVARREREMFEKVLRVPVTRRDESTDTEHYRVVFMLAAGTGASAGPGRG